MRRGGVGGKGRRRGGRGEGDDGDRGGHGVAKKEEKNRDIKDLSLSLSLFGRCIRGRRELMEKEQKWTIFEKVIIRDYDGNA